MINRIIAVCTCLVLAACSAPEQATQPTLNSVAESYVKLVLKVGQYDKDVVDAYYGPDEWKPEPVAEGESMPADNMLARAEGLQEQLNNIDTTAFSPLEKARWVMLGKQLTAIATKISMLNGVTYSFDEEAKRLYDAEPPTFPLSHFDDLLEKLDSKLPGEEPLSERYNAFASNFIIPKSKLDDVFRVAIAEARKRTLQHFTMAENENFVLEYVNDKSWSGYNYYQGNGQSLIQLNTDFPIFIDRAIDLAAHEGYPGHHVFNALLEQNLVKKRQWMEFSIYQLFSPQSLIAEGSANYGIDVVFPGESRLAYEKEVLFPLAGLDASQADLYYEIQDIRAKLNYAGNEAARLYLNGDINREQAAAMLEKYLMYEPDRALQRTRFIDQYRSYVINYNLGKDLVAEYVESQGGTADNPEKRWQIFQELLSNPHTASSIKAKK